MHVSFNCVCKNVFEPTIVKVTMKELILCVSGEEFGTMQRSYVERKDE